MTVDNISRVSDRASKKPNIPTDTSRLMEIIVVEGHGEFGGIYFDLRHERLNPDQWQTHLLGHSAGMTVSNPDLPLIWFPWFGKYPFKYGSQRNERWLSKNAALADDKPKRHPRYFTKDTAECVVEPGDTILIDRVEITQTGYDFEHPHDAEIRLAFLKILRKNGNYQLISDPLVFRGVNGLIDENSHDLIFLKIQQRICEHFKIDSIDLIKELQKDKSYAYQALVEANALQQMINEAGDLFPDDWVCQATILGYLWAKAEAEINLKPLALAAHEARENSKKWGKDSGEKRRTNAREGWMRIAAEMARDLRKQDPYLSQEDLAFEIRAVWKDEHSKAPGTARLKQYIGELEHSNQLKRRIPKPKSREKVRRIERG